MDDNGIYKLIGFGGSNTTEEVQMRLDQGESFYVNIYVGGIKQTLEEAKKVNAHLS